MRSMNMPRFSTLLLATILLWALGYALWVTNFLAAPPPFALDHALRGIPLFVFGLMMCLAIGPALAWIQDSGRTVILVVFAIVTVIVATLLLALFYELVMRVIAPHWGPPTWENFLEQVPMMAWLFVTWVLLYFALVADATRRDREVRLAQANAAAIDAQHRLLVQQINPHFLFNTLNTISSFVTSRPEEARDLIAELAALLRDSIRQTDAEFYPLRHECEMAGKYLRIIGMRFGDRFKPIMVVPELLANRMVPRGLLLTLLENAVTHGVSMVTEDCALTVQCVASDNRLAVEVQNRYDGGTASVPAHRGGLAALDARLQVLYGDAYSLDYGGDAGIWHVRVSLPIAELKVEPASDELAGKLTRNALSHQVPT
jgi:hypothetical protein